MARIETIARWAASLRFDDVPADVFELARAQRRSVLAGVAGSLGDPASRRVVDAVAGWARPGPAPLAGTDRTSSVEDAVYTACALSVALDFDDYLCFAHTGHSAVLVPMLLAAETRTSGQDQLTAQVVANEVGARLGGACLIGPLNGQLWSHVHAAGAALAAGRLLGLGADELAHALAISLSHTPRPTVPGFMAPDTKLLTAAEPAVAGLRAARLAAEGVTGPVDTLDRPDGFLSAFADAPLPGMLSGLGESWATLTLCVKPYPGCAYVDTIVDALCELGPPAAEDIAAVDVTGGLLTCGMDALSAPFATADPTPVTITFSVPWTVAVTITGGSLGPEHLRPSWLAEHRDTLRSVASRVRLHHDWDLTRATTGAFAPLLPPRVLGRDAGPARLLRGLAATRHRTPSLIGGLGDLVRAFRTVRGTSQDLPDRFWDPDAVDTFRMTFPAEVRVQLRDGRRRTARVDVPRGGAGHPTEGPAVVAREKLGASDADAAIEADDPELWRSLAR